MTVKARVVPTAAFLQIGLEMDGFTRWKSYKYTANLKRFTDHYGMLPSTVAKVWQMLRDSNVPAARLEKNAKPTHLLLALSFLWNYETEQGYSRDFKMTKKTGRKWHWIYVRKIAALLPSLVRILLEVSLSLSVNESTPALPTTHIFLGFQIGTLEDNDDGLVYFMTVDGTHAPILEPQPFSTEWSSHKRGGKPAVNYELGILIHKPRIAWVYGPTRPGKHNDLQVLQQALIPALAALPNQPRRLLGDGIYGGEPDWVSTKSTFDPKEISTFKNRALARHEKYNGLLKNFNVLHHEFRHGKGEGNMEANHQLHFHAVIVFVQVQIDMGGYRLFDAYP